MSSAVRMFSTGRRLASVTMTSVVRTSYRQHTSRITSSSTSSGTTTNDKIKYDSDTQTLAKWLDVGIVKRKGRAFDADSCLIAANEAAPFPAVRGYNLNGTDMVVPDTAKSSHAKLVCFSIKHYGFTLVRSWCDPFVQRFAAEHCSTVQCYELCFVEYGFLSMAKNVFAQNLKPKILEQQHGSTILSFGGLNVRIYILCPVTCASILLSPVVLL
jgi:hypothetical protein